MRRAIGGLLFKMLRLAKEPPFRLFVRQAVRLLNTSAQTKADWDAVERPHCLVGMLEGAKEAVRESIHEISVIEFGVAAGKGLLILEAYAPMVERETRVRIHLYGFDMGKGMPELCGDHRDHPDVWKPGDYQMNEHLLRSRLSDRTTLLIGPMAETVPKFVEELQRAPIGFVVFDVDLYSSTRDALRLFTHPGKRTLRRVPLYFDDVDLFQSHRFAGELLAIDEFNLLCKHTKIDRWRGLTEDRVFFESSWLRKMYVAHDLEAISRVMLTGPPAQLRE